MISKNNSMRKLFRQMWLLLKPFLFYEFLGLILTILLSFALFATPLVTRYCIDEVIPGNSMEKLYKGLALFAGVCLLQPIFGYLNSLLFLNIGQRVLISIRKEMFQRIIFSPLLFFQQRSNGEILSRLIGDGQMASSFITSFFVTFIKNVVSIIVIVTGMFAISIKITSIVLFIFSLFFIFYFIITKKFVKMSLEVQKNSDTVYKLINQTIDKISTIKSFLLEQFKCSEIEKQFKKNKKDNITIGSLSALLNNSIYVLIIISLSIIYGMGTIFVMEKSISLGSIIALGIYFQMLAQPAMELLNSNISFNSVIPIFDRIYEFLQLKNEDQLTNIAIHPLTDTVEKTCGISVKMENVSFYYNPQTPVLKSINLFFPENSISALIGDSGSGKSTIVKLLSRFYIPQQGTICFNGNDISMMSIVELRSKIGYVDQEVGLFNMSIFDNLQLNNKNITKDQIYNMCKELNIHDKILGLPEGYNTLVTEKINLSGGEKQRLGIVRAVLRKPSILILDEPTSSLDSKNRDKIIDQLNKLRMWTTVIIISHSKTAISIAENIYELRNGTISKVEEVLDLSKNIKEIVTNL